MAVQQELASCDVGANWKS